jgi:glyceraldehyde 3-phosphate dehydrogenase
MKRIKVAINGFGRIGRLAYRIAHKRPNIDIVAINDLVDPDNLAYLLTYDSVHRKYDEEVKAEGSFLVVGGKKTRVCCEKEPEKLPWRELEVDFVIESTGRFTKQEDAQKHIAAGAKKVVISAPAKGEIPTFVMGVNHQKYDHKVDNIVSNASCTTNCLAPVTKVLLDNFGIEEGLMTTVHALTATQPSVDGPTKKDYRDGRAAGFNIIPASTGAAKAVGLCIPEVKGKLTGMAFRVPVADVSVVDLTVKVSKSTTYDEICSCMKRAAEGSMKDILGYCEEDVVSSDFIGSSFSSIFDKKAGIALNDKFFKIVSWYDNEMGYSYRIVDLVEYMASKKP